MTTDAEYISAINAAWNKFRNDVAPLTTTQGEWDTAYGSYLDEMEAARVAHGHPPGQPRKRP